jgi:hypothetical protein
MNMRNFCDTQTAILRTKFWKNEMKVKVTFFSRNFRAFTYFGHLEGSNATQRPLVMSGNSWTSSRDFQSDQEAGNSPKSEKAQKGKQINGEIQNSHSP